jgi:poly(3-hydroxybutyrate) depolymerase
MFAFFSPDEIFAQAAHFVPWDKDVRDAHVLRPLGEGFHPFLYPLYHLHADTLAAWRLLSRGASTLLRPLAGIGPATLPLGVLAGALDVLGHSETTHARPHFDIVSTIMEGEEVTVIEEEILRTPFATLLHFRKEMGRSQPRVLLIAPMSGHFSTLLRNTVETLLPDHDVFITDWINARDVPVAAGGFDLSDFIDHIIDFLIAIGPGAHVVAVCQPAVPALAAVAVMAEERHPALPRSLTMMAGPIDTRINPTRVNDLARSRPLAWFEQNLIARVPWRHRGAGRRVYPGFVQLSAFVSMNFDRHVTAHWRQWRNVTLGDLAKAEAHREFYSEYLAIMDLPAEFYLETVRNVFQEHHLPRGLLTWHGHNIDLAAIETTHLLAIEAERDDICGLGQTRAALTLCENLPDSRKTYHLQQGIGHYGVFSGKRWRNEIYPLLRATIAACA